MNKLYCNGAALGVRLWRQSRRPGAVLVPLTPLSHLSRSPLSRGPGIECGSLGTFSCLRHIRYSCTTNQVTYELSTFHSVFVLRSPYLRSKSAGQTLNTPHSFNRAVQYCFVYLLIILTALSRCSCIVVYHVFTNAQTCSQSLTVTSQIKSYFKGERVVENASKVAFWSVT